MHMRRRILILCLAFTLLFSGCQLPSASKAQKLLPLSFRATVDMQVQKETYRAVCTFLDAESVSIAFQKPENLETFTVTQTKTDCQIDFLGLHQEAQEPCLQKESFLHQIFLAYVALQDENQYVIKRGKEVSYYIGKMPEAFQFTWTKDNKTNEMIALSIPQAKLECTFSGVTML